MQQAVPPTGQLQRPICESLVPGWQQYALCEHATVCQQPWFRNMSLVSVRQIAHSATVSQDPEKMYDT